MKRFFSVAIFLMTVLVVGHLAVGDKDAQAEKGIDLEAARATYEQYCGKCHDLGRALGRKKDKDGWESTVSRMSDYHKRLGGPIPEDAEDAIVKYLLETAGK